MVVIRWIVAFCAVSKGLLLTHQDIMHYLDDLC